ncbi:hypothetical protein VTI74DRAFT_11466 [Chaetomium olivicolor]
MEFLSGYAAAKPYLTYEVEPSPHSKRAKPARSNSTSGSAGSTIKRSRIPGHARTNSASTSSSGGRTDNQASPHIAGGWLQHAGGADASGAGIDPAVTSGAGDRADPTTEQHHIARRESNRDRDRERMPTSGTYYQEKQLPATPRLSTADANSKQVGAGSPLDHHSGRVQLSANAAAVAALGNPGTVIAAVAFSDRRMTQQHAAMFPLPDSGIGRGPRAESVSSVSGATTMSHRTMHSSEQPAESAYQLRPFVVRNGRTYLADPTLPYPLPVDLEEIHRQSLKTMLLIQLFGRPICAPAFANKPPARILEVGCGTGFWSMMCYRYYESRGTHKDVQFTGIDIVPLPPSANGTSVLPSSSGDLSADTRPDKEMNWRFVQHDLRKVPLPFPDGTFDFVMVKEMGLATSLAMQQSLVEEYIRILTPGGTIELWETDHVLRMLRPHVPECATTSGPTEQQDEPPSATDTSATNPANPTDPEDGTTTKSDAPEISGAYVMTPHTPLSTPLNTFLVEYNSWVSRALEARALCVMPCTVIGPLLIQEAEVLTGVGSRRLAVPLSEIRWEREGVGGVVTKDGKSYIDTTKARAGRSGVGAGGKEAAGGGSGGKGLEPAAAALRRTALMTVVQGIQALEPMLREVSGKSQDEWDTWLGKMMNDLVKENGTSWGECLEVGAWWARKR